MVRRYGVTCLNICFAEGTHDLARDNTASHIYRWWAAILHLLTFLKLTYATLPAIMCTVVIIHALN